MRIISILTLCGVLLSGVALAQPGHQVDQQAVAFADGFAQFEQSPFADEMLDPPIMLAPMPVQVRGRTSRGLTNSQMLSQIRTALQNVQPNDTPWAQRDIAEEQLVQLGPDAVNTMRTELPSRDSYQYDALQTAIFRIENGPLIPNDLLRDWGAKRFTGPDPATLKITRVLDIRATAGLWDLFTHHMFYVVENPRDKTRAVVALAADGKVQPLEDDAALTKFLRAEAGTRDTAEGKKRLAGAAALLAISRSVDLVTPGRMGAATVQDQKAEMTLNVPDVQTKATITFDAKGVVQTVATELTKVDPAPSPPPPRPRAVPTPPSVPGGLP